MTGRTHNDVAQRKTRGHDSNAAYVAHEGQKRLSAAQLKRRDRIRQGLCPTCGKEVRDEVKLGKIIVRGRIVRKCDDCLLDRAIWREGQAKKAAQAVEEQQMPQTLIGERIHRAAEIDTAKAAFASRSKSFILVVGVRTDNVQREARDHDRLILWPSATDRNTSALPSIPTGVSVIMTTRFCSHQMSQYLREQANTRGLFMFSGLLNTGDIRRHLAELLDLDRAKTNVGTSDDGPTTVLPPLPPLRSPAPRPVAAAKEEKTMPSPVASTVTTGQTPEANIDAALSLIRESQAALQLVAEQLERTKIELAANAEKFAKFKALKGLLSELGD